MVRSGNSLIGPMTRIPFTVKDKKRINDYMKDNMENNMDGGYLRDLGPNPVNIRRSATRRRQWPQDEDCVGQEDPVSMENIPPGRGFRLEAENRCYDVNTLSQIKRMGTSLVGPLTRIPFTENDKRRIDEYIINNPNPLLNGGKKKRTRRINRKKHTHKKKHIRKTTIRRR